MEHKDLQKGMTVTYVPNRAKIYGREGIVNKYIGREVGKVTSWNESYVFVDYNGSDQGKATRIEDLEKGDTSFYCANEWDSVLDGAFGRCGTQCRNCR
jgi:hypothetical protein